MIMNIIVEYYQPDTARYLRVYLHKRERI